MRSLESVRRMRRVSPLRGLKPSRRFPSASRRGAFGTGVPSRMLPSCSAGSALHEALRLQHALPIDAWESAQGECVGHALLEQLRETRSCNIQAGRWRVRGMLHASRLSSRKALSGPGLQLSEPHTIVFCRALAPSSPPMEPLIYVIIVLAEPREKTTVGHTCSRPVFWSKG